MPPSSQRKGDSKCSLACELDLPTSPAPVDTSWSPQEGHTKQQQLLLEFAGQLYQEVFCAPYVTLVQNSNDSEVKTLSTEEGSDGHCEDLINCTGNVESSRRGSKIQSF